MVAFISLFKNIDMLFSSRGLVPAGVEDTYIYLVCLFGIGISIMNIFGAKSHTNMVIMWVIYSVAVRYGGVFFSYQWDVLLLEAGYYLFT